MVTAAQKVAIAGIGGTATGVGVSTLLAELSARVTGLTSWPACGLKALVKGVVGLIGYGVSTRVTGGYSSFAEIFSYTSFGSILLDVALAAYPGGIPGLAEDWAVTARVFAAGGRGVAGELSELEREAPVTDVTGKKATIL